MCGLPALGDRIKLILEIPNPQPTVHSAMIVKPVHKPKRRNLFEDAEKQFEAKHELEEHKSKRARGR